MTGGTQARWRLNRLMGLAGDSTVVARESARIWRPLLGGPAVWLFMTVEVVTFGMFLLVYAWGWRSDAEAFAQSQSLLHVESAVRGTAMLLLGSLAAYLGALAHEAGRSRAAQAWLGGAATLAVLFSVNKIVEYSSPELAGVSLSTNRFWFSYLFLTGMHLLHVMGGVIIFAWLAWVAGRGPQREGAFSVETGAVYWHLVDLIWILLFPILYLMHP
jgi:nitric oxide reductase NorE protein